MGDECVGRGRSHGPLWATVALLALYVLSIGPACWLSRRLDTESFLVIYQPVGWAGSHCRPFGDVLLWYLHFWGVDVG